MVGLSECRARVAWVQELFLVGWDSASPELPEWYSAGLEPASQVFSAQELAGSGPALPAGVVLAQAVWKGERMPGEERLV